MRLIFIPGFGEDPRIFSQIAPALPGEKLFIHNLDVLGATPTPAITAIGYAQLLLDKHQISGEDIVIGHSMGGWVAYAIKHLAGCPIVQIASWTDPKKVLFPVKDPELIYRFVRNGWYFNQFTKRLLLWVGYRNQPSAPVFSMVFQNLIDSPTDYIINQLRIIFNPVELGNTLQPDLRIHAKKDTIIRFPDQPAVTVPGDHFSLATHPQDVIRPINTFLTTVS